MPVFNTTPVLSTPNAQQRPASLSGLPMDENLIKKKGFLLAVSNNGAARDALDAEKLAIAARYNALVSGYRENQEKRIENARQTLAQLNEQHWELKIKKEDYDTYLNSLPAEKREILTKLDSLNKKLGELLQAAGKAKEGVVTKSLEEMEKALAKLITINGTIQDGQNKHLSDAYTEEQGVYDERKRIFLELLKDYQSQYGEVKGRMKMLAKDSINSQTSGFLLFLGSVAALVSGWWFSVWAGKLPDNNKGYLGEGLSSKSFLLTKIGDFMASYSPLEIMGGVLAYLGSVVLVSLLCYWAQVKMGFIIGKRKKSRSKSDTEREVEEYEFDLEEQEKFLKAKVKSGSWMALCLKILPLVYAALPLVAVISHKDTNGTGDTIQDVFDGISNQFIGSAIAVMFAVFALLFLTRITENRYHRTQESKKADKQVGDDEKADDKTVERNGPGGYTVFYVGFILFALMMVAMLMCKYADIGFFGDIRRIAVFGLIVSVAATGFSLAYGYIFNGLSNNADVLLYYIDNISAIVAQLSKPFRVNYTSNAQVRMRIYEMQDKMFQVIGERQDLAKDTVTGKDIERDTPIPGQLLTPAPGEINGEGTSAERESRKRRWLWKRLRELALIRWLFGRRLPHGVPAASVSQNVSSSETNYSAEIYAQVADLNKQIEQLEKQLENIRVVIDDKWKNNGAYASIRSQLANKMNEINEVLKKISSIEEETHTEAAKLADKREKEFVLLDEGFFTGIWYNENKNGHSSLAIDHP